MSNLALLKGVCISKVNCKSLSCLHSISASGKKIFVINAKFKKNGKFTHSQKISHLRYCCCSDCSTVNLPVSIYLHFQLYIKIQRKHFNVII